MDEKEEFDYWFDNVFNRDDCDPNGECGDYCGSCTTDDLDLMFKDWKDLNDKM